VASPERGSVLLIEVPEAEPAVQSLRQQLDANAALGIPAHITVLYPFMPADAIDDVVLAGLKGLFAPVSQFGIRLDRTGWFGDNVLWLGPDDDAPLRALTDRAWQAFPAFPPFRGQFDDVIPHLTVGHEHPADALRAAEESVATCLPIRARARRSGLLIRPGRRAETPHLVTRRMSMPLAICALP
jgi:hypothetical protein